LMVKKTEEEKKPQAQAAPAPAPAQPQTQVQQAQPQTQPQQQTLAQSQPPAQPTVQSPPPPQPSQPAPNPQAQVGGVPIDESAVTALCEVGFPRDQVVAALQAAFGYADRAYDYLLNGIPESLQAPQQPTHQTQPAPSQQPVQQPPARQPTSQAQVQGARQTGVFDALKQHPQFPQLCQLAQTGGEEALRQILTYLQQTQPELVKLIAENKNEFIALLNTPVPGAQAAGGATVQRGPAGSPPGVVRLPVTPQDEVAINNLVGMGFDRNRVLEAYFLFEKDAAMAAEYLVNNPQDDPMLGGPAGDGEADDGMYGEDELDDEDVGDY